MANSHLKHTSVLLDEAVNGLNIQEDGIYIDGTFGRGGHSRLILSKLGPNGRLMAIDCDHKPLKRQRRLLTRVFLSFMGRFLNWQPM